MKSKTNKFLIILTIIVLLFAFLNPTRKDFVEYLGKPNDNNMSGLSRKQNFIIFSIYEEQTTFTKKLYFAIIKNFIKIEQ